MQILTICWKVADAAYVNCLKESDGAKFSNADSSSWYFECSNGNLLVKMCPLEHVFNNDLKQCVHGTDITTDEFGLPEMYSTLEEDIFSVTEPSINFTVTNVPIAEPSLDLFEEENPCPCRDTLSLTYFENRFNCEKYFICYRSRPIEMSCCRGFYWSQQHKKCISQIGSSCGIKPIHAASVNLPNCPARGCAVYPHLTVCEYFYYCEEGVRSIQQCDAFYQWDFYAQRCVIRSEAKCITSIPMHLRSQLYLGSSN